MEHCFEKSDFPGADTMKAEKGAFLLMEGDASDQGAFLLLEGKVEVFVSDVDGSETLLFTLEGGQLLGEMGLLGAEQRMACVRCLTPVKALRISRQLWNQRMQDQAFVRKVLQSMVVRFTATQNVVRRLGQSQALNRLGVYLLGREEWADEKGDTISVEMPTHANLARMLNCTREHVTKVMKRFTQGGALVVEGDGRKATLSRAKIYALLTLNK